MPFKELQNQQKPAIIERQSRKQPPSVVMYTRFDFLVSRRFFERLNKNFPLKGSPRWNLHWAEEVYRLRKLDRWSKKDIRRTLDFICDDIQSSGFCFAKNIRSLQNIRKKWKNEMTAFANANQKRIEMEEDCLPEQQENEIFWDLPDKLRDKADDFYQVEMKMKSSLLGDKNSILYDEFAQGLTRLLCEFVTVRKWSSSLFTRFLNFLYETGFESWNLKFLQQKTKEFFQDSKNFTPGFFYQEIGGKRVFEVDRTYQKRVNDFMRNKEWV